MQSGPSPLNPPDKTPNRRSPETPLRDTLMDSIPLMHFLANIANIPWGKFKRMILVLEVDCLPQIYTEGFLQETDNPLSVSPIIVNGPAPAPPDIVEVYNSIVQRFRLYNGEKLYPDYGQNSSVPVEESTFSTELVGPTTGLAPLTDKLSHETNCHFCGVQLVHPGSTNLQNELAIETLHIRKGHVFLCQKCYRSCGNDVR